ncbi:transglycosylase domain-containing protein [Virgibacillus sp. YIM 98842]|uniref:transglycosylase domain-containing protein n=1 Tax=Virgibacillus sp. YIM 98842 TaxID=2663533 RepID=UPI001F0A020D|nr:transglycosylase domain-containing protein [Virgibacillus sp. YIM 98842]
MKSIFSYIKHPLPVKIAVSICLAAAGGIFSVYLISFLMGPPSLANDQNTIYYSRHGEMIGEERGTEYRRWVPLEDISEDAIDATLVVEDQHFFDHSGFDFKRIISALITDIRNWSLKEGASTLSQQYARNLYLTHEKTWTRKIKEAFYTIRLEMFYSKKEILEGYLNTVYYGHGSYGIEAASNYFFNKPSSDLSLAEAAMLAGIPRGPSYYSPLADRQRADNRQKRILNLLNEHGKINDQELFLAARENLAFQKVKSNSETMIGGYFQDEALKEAAELLELDTDEIRSGGYEIHTTLHESFQQNLEDEIKDTIHTESDIEAGAVAIEPQSGEVLAMIGGRDYRESPFNRAFQAKRMPGSAFKPFLYYAALENGYTANTMLMSQPTAFQLDDDEVYQPSNFNGYYANDSITLAQAIALSDNVYAVKTNMYLGAEKLVETARSFGLTSDLPAVPSLALGTAAVSVKEMVTGYGTLANGGKEINAHLVKKIVDRNGKTVFERKEQEGKLVLDPKKTFILTHLLTGMFDSELDGYMAVTGSTIADNLTRLYAGKSGTTTSDSWMIGYSPSLVTGVWLGYDDNRPMELTEEKDYAKIIWANFMERTHENLPQEAFPQPPGLVAVPVDPQTGQRATPYCEQSRVMYFEKGTEPSAFCTDHFHEENQTDDKSMVERLFEMFGG